MLSPSFTRCVSLILLTVLTIGCQKKTLLDEYADKGESDALATETAIDETIDVDAPPVEASESTSESAPATPRISDHAFREAARVGDGPTVAAAIKTSVDVNSPNENGTTALMLAAYDGHMEIVKLLLKNNAQVNRRDAMDRTALIYSSSGKNPETVKVLLDAGAKVDLVDNDERFTALMFAAAEGNLEVAKLLLENGANPALADKDGETSIQFAANNGHAAMVDLLRNALEARSNENAVNK